MQTLTPVGYIFTLVAGRSATSWPAGAPAALLSQTTRERYLPYCERLAG